jgi:hypothetical protein
VAREDAVDFRPDAADTNEPSFVTEPPDAAPTEAVLHGDGRTDGRHDGIRAIPLGALND